MVIQPLMMGIRESLFHGALKKPLRNWVDEFILYSMEILGVYPAPVYRLVVYPIIYRVSAPSKGWLFKISAINSTTRCPGTLEVKFGGSMVIVRINGLVISNLLTNGDSLG